MQAKALLNPNPATYTVAFNSNGGSDVPRQRVKKGGKATRPTNPTRTGYTFVEWDKGVTAYDFSTPVTSNFTLTAKWQINTYTVTFNSDGGSAVASQTVNYGSTATEPEDPTKVNSVFKGWQKNGVDYDFTTPVTADTTLVATWNPTYAVMVTNLTGDSITLNYRKVGDTEDTTETLAHLGTVTLPVRIEEGDALSTAYSKIEAAIGESGTWAADLTQVITENTTLTISVQGGGGGGSTSNP